MCTNYVPTRGDRLREYFGAAAPDDDFPEQAWPGYRAPLVRRGADGTRLCETACFGLIPAWSRDGHDYRRCYNARSETVATKPSFRDAWRRRQLCIVPAEAVFEPDYAPNATGRPVRWRIERDDGTPFGMAAIWSRWQPPGGEAPVLSFSLLTINADAHPMMRRFHAPGDEKRSIVVLPAARYDDWLDADANVAAALLQPFDAATMRTRPDPLPARKPARPPRPAARADPELPFSGDDTR